ncbi:flavin reductase [Altererythrobacter salegens]|uniref:Flavin reductase n=1 Tax=Croceibacterium salegens TaxID=1737568 RepID=A0A6I4T0C7_9SPHN|nr:flavin reductase [Croceibacterium salegens]
MRRLAASVHVVTCDHAGDRLGCTATAVCSLSDQPPSLLVCLNQKSQTASGIKASGRFAVNVLASDDRAVAAHFASRASSAEKFARGEWLAAPNGAPLLSSALVSFACSVEDIVSAGSHWMIVGSIEAISLGDEERASLLYSHGNYGSFSSRSPQELQA